MVERVAAERPLDRRFALELQAHAERFELALAHNEDFHDDPLNLVDVCFALEQEAWEARLAAWGQGGGRDAG